MMNMEKFLTIRIRKFTRSELGTLGLCMLLLFPS